jgi:hypothetical protein
MRASSDTYAVQQILAAPPQPYDVSITYYLHDGETFDWSTRGVSSSIFFVNDPFSSTRTINIRGIGDFDNRIDTILVNLKYVDELNNYTQTHATTLTAESTFDVWRFPAILEAGGMLTYAGTIRFKDRNVEISRRHRSKAGMLFSSAPCSARCTSGCSRTSSTGPPPSG